MAVLTEPGAAKAAITAGGTDLVHFSFPIKKSEDTATINPVDGTPDIEIAGKCTDGTLDSDLQVVNPEASARWIKTWFDTGANIRAAHDPKWPAGRGLSVDPSDPHRIKVLVADPRAKHLVRQKVLKDFSIGIMHPDVRVGDPRFRHLDPMGKATGGIITDRPDGLTGLGEISLVDRGANFGASFQLVKAAADGTAEWVGELSAPGDVLTKMAVPDPAGGKRRKTVTVDLPANMSLSIKPSDLAKLTTFKQNLVLEQTATKAAAAGPGPVGEQGPEPHVAKAATDVDSPELAAIKVAEAGVYKRDIDTATRRRLAGEGRALPNLSYPVETHEDAMNAAGLAVSGHGDVGAAKKLIRRIARKEGWADVLDRLKGGKKTKVAVPADAKTATPDVAKCGTCGGKGMAGGKPCPDCKKGAKTAKKAAVAAKRRADAATKARDNAYQATFGESRDEVLGLITKKKGKLKVLCPGCGARQNKAHAHCPECGAKLPASALNVAKNHNFTCLGCGKDLDKGEKFCPQCGKQNPGYLPEADHQIPANKTTAAQAGKGRVLSKKRKGKKTPASASGAVSAPEQPVPGHREPDGEAVEAFEADMGASDGDKAATSQPAAAKAAKPPKAKGKKGGKGKKKPPPWVKDGDGDGDAEKAAAPAGYSDPEIGAALRLKALNVPLHLGIAHDLTCPAYESADVAKCWPRASLNALDLAEWQEMALDKAAGAPLAEAQGIEALLNATMTLRTADPFDLADLREHAHKMFRDANPGPGTFPRPTEISPQRYNRPYLSAGHAAASPGHDGPNHARIPAAGGIQPENYHRDYLTAGHAADSPGNTRPSPPMPAPGRTGVPTGGPSRAFARDSMREGEAHAMMVLHDHISGRFPALCPMHPHFADTPVPTPQGVPPVTPAPGSSRKTAKPTPEARARKAERKAVRAGKRKAARIRRKAVARRRAVESKVLKGKLSVDDGRARLGLEPWGLPETQVAPAVAKAAAAATGPAEPSQEDVLLAAVKAATAPLVKHAKRQDRQIKALRRTADAIAAQPDTSAAPFRGVALAKSSSPAGATVAQPAEQAQASTYAHLYNEWATTTDPAMQAALAKALAPYWNPAMQMTPMTPPT